MTAFYFTIALLLLGTLIAGLRRIRLGPTRADAMLAAQLFGTTGVAILLVIGEATGGVGVRDVALVFAVLAAVNVTAFTWRPVRDGR